ncbi:IclR family transcriptional regulator [Tamaricihabitans halophyticus]|uniref:Glycerol operon regulatory protein n=1 Tax=Tamaricihabitans halophyticus TaxID=1262583 RepID=A0A4R2QPV2_9PSEU|nr:IclR family transcriptional regulator [Tamaricihabitans halophyticus]TCP50994.1 IclR family transcriptional regulator [Tamaricihabitans halophyticus]
MTAEQSLVDAAVDERVAGTQTISRALAILRSLRDAGPDLGLSEIASTAGLSTSTVHRILRALTAAGYVSGNSAERYRLGREAFLLGMAAERGLGFDLVLPLLREVSEATGESVNLVVRDGNEAVVVLRVESTHPLRFAQPVGTRIPLHCTSTGKTLLAFSADPKAEVTALDKLERFTGATITHKRELASELTRIRERGYSVNVAERVPGVHGVAAPVHTKNAAVHLAVAVQGPDIRMPADRIHKLAETVIDLADRIATAVPAGYQL